MRGEVHNPVQTPGSNIPGSYLVRQGGLQNVERVPREVP